MSVGELSYRVKVIENKQKAVLDKYADAELIDRLAAGGLTEHAEKNLREILIDRGVKYIDDRLDGERAKSQEDDSRNTIRRSRNRKLYVLFAIMLWGSIGSVWYGSSDLGNILINFIGLALIGAPLIISIGKTNGLFGPLLRSC